MRIRLMAHIPYQSVLRCIQNMMKSYGELYDPKSRTKMPAGIGDAKQQELTYFIRE